MTKLMLSVLSLFSLIYPVILYAESEPVELWKIFCAHQLLAQEQPVALESGQVVVLENEQWLKLVADLDHRTMPAGFVRNDANLDAWLKCENEQADRFAAAEFLASGRAHFQEVVSVNADGRLPMVSSVFVREGGEIYAERWNEFLKSLQKSVTLPKPRHTILPRSR